ncbi:hypothetical protein [Robiginitalea sp.]|uniref:hypothetical protein n=1 Tax=Robiginitalea sp. TaxID=1902411 RepID=UPI003C755F27
MIKKIQSGIKQRKARVFFVFLLFSITAWLITRLSETYSHSVDFALNYTHRPEGMLMVDTPPEELGVRIRANGFQLLGYQLSPKKIAIDLREVRQGNKGYFISPQTYRNQIEQQLSQGIGLLQVPSDTIFLNFQKMKSKTVPVRVPGGLNFAQNYMLEGELILEPEQVHLLGPPSEIDSIEVVFTEPLPISEIKGDFKKELLIDTKYRQPNTEFSQDRIKVSGSVFRFSEAVIEVPVEVINLPDSLVVQTFPNMVGVLCKGRIEGLKSLNPEDFRLVADYSSPSSETGRLLLNLALKPEGVHETQLLEISVEFITRRE